MLWATEVRCISWNQTNTLLITVKTSLGHHGGAVRTQIGKLNLLSRVTPEAADWQSICPVSRQLPVRFVLVDLWYEAWISARSHICLLVPFQKSQRYALFLQGSCECMHSYLESKVSFKILLFSLSSLLLLTLWWIYRPLQKSDGTGEAKRPLRVIQGGRCDSIKTSPRAYTVW